MVRGLTPCRSANLSNVSRISALTCCLSLAIACSRSCGSSSRSDSSARAHSAGRGSWMLTATQQPPAWPVAGELKSRMGVLYNRNGTAHTAHHVERSHPRRHPQPPLPDRGVRSIRPLLLPLRDRSHGGGGAGGGRVPV